MSEPDGRRAALREYLGGALMAVGGLMAGLSGLCTAYFAIRYHPFGLTRDAYAMGVMFSGLVGMLLLGGLPFLLGLMIFRVGRRLSRASRPTPPDVAKTFE